MEDSLFPILMQLAASIPVLLIYLVGIVLAAVFWRRCPVPSMLTLIAMLLLLGTSVGHTILFHYLVRVREEWAWSHHEFARVLSFLGIASSIVRALAFGLVLTAVYVGRKGLRSSTSMAAETPIRSPTEYSSQPQAPNPHIQE